MLVEISLPRILNRFIHREAQQREFSAVKRELPQAPPGTNAFFMQFDGLKIGGFNESLQASDQDYLSITREKGECQGGICVEITYIQHGDNGEGTMLDIHVRGDDRIAFGDAYRFRLVENNAFHLDEKFDTTIAIQNLRRRLIKLRERGIQANEDPKNIKLPT